MFRECFDVRSKLLRRLLLQLQHEDVRGSTTSSARVPPPPPSVEVVVCYEAAIAAVLTHWTKHYFFFSFWFFLWCSCFLFLWKFSFWKWTVCKKLYGILPILSFADFFEKVVCLLIFQQYFQEPLLHLFLVSEELENGIRRNCHFLCVCIFNFSLVLHVLLSSSMSNSLSFMFPNFN